MPSDDDDSVTRWPNYVVRNARRRPKMLAINWQDFGTSRSRLSNMLPHRRIG